MGDDQRDKQKRDEKGKSNQIRSGHNWPVNAQMHIRYMKRVSTEPLYALSNTLGRGKSFWGTQAGL